MRVRRIISILLFLLSINGSILNHSGRTDKFGGHHDRKNGSYHSHGTEVEENNAGFVVCMVVFGILVVGILVKNALDD